MVLAVLEPAMACAEAGLGPSPKGDPSQPRISDRPGQDR